MTSGTLTLAGFLLARIAEDEQWARACEKVYPGEWELSDRGWMAKVTADEPAFRIVAELNQDQVAVGTVDWLGDALNHVSRWYPARVLAECEGKRQLIERLTPSLACQEGCWWDVQRFLALPYAGHPDYREEWRP